MAEIIGVIMMLAGIGGVFGGRLFPAQRELVERCGIYVFLAGLGIWAMAWAIGALAS